MSKFAYIAGPYGHRSDSIIEFNIQRAARFARKYWRLGYTVICPHLNSAHFGGVVQEEYFIEGYLNLLRTGIFSTLVVIPGYEQSIGTLQEIEVAKELGIKIIYEKLNGSC